MSSGAPPAGADEEVAAKFGLPFLQVWIGQLVSLVGSALSTFVLGVWVLQETNSTTSFALISMSAALPAVLLAPLTGVLADRMDRRRLMIWSDLVGGLGSAAILAVVALGDLRTWHIYLFSAVSAVCVVCHSVALNSAMPGMVTKAALGRVNGLMQFALGAQIAAPALAAGLLELVGLRGVLLIDIATMLVGVALLLVAKLPRAATHAPEAGVRVTIREDLLQGLRYLRAHAGLRSLVIVYACFNMAFALAGVLVQPLILSFSTVGELGTLMLLGGSGILAGSLIMASWGGPKRRVRGICLLLAYGGVVLAAHSLRPSFWLIAVAAPLFLLTIPMLNGTAMTLVQTVTDPSVMGRVIATVRMLATAANPVVYLLAGPLADGLAEPAMTPGGTLSGSLGELIGTGDGRGLAAIFLVAGAGLLILAATAWSLPSLRGLDDIEKSDT